MGLFLVVLSSIWAVLGVVEMARLLVVLSASNHGWKKGSSSLQGLVLGEYRAVGYALCLWLAFLVLMCIN